MTPTPTAEERHTSAREALVWPPIMGVTPGLASTGLTIRVGTEAVLAVTVDRPRRRTATAEEGDYALAVLEGMDDLVRAAQDTLAGHVRRLGRPRDEGRVRIAVETVPIPKGRPSKGRQVALAGSVLHDLSGAGAVLGAVIGRHRDVVRVPTLGAPTTKNDGPQDDAPADPTTAPSRGPWSDIQAPETLSRRKPPGWPESGSDRSRQRAAWGIAGAAQVLTTRSTREQITLASGRAQTLITDALLDDIPGLVAVLREACDQSPQASIFNLPGVARVVLAGRYGPEVAREVSGRVTAHISAGG